MKVHLIKRPKQLANGKRTHYWTLRWSDKRGGPGISPSVVSAASPELKRCQRRTG